MAFTPQIMNMYPFVLAYRAGPELKGKASLTYSTDDSKDSGYCAEVDFGLAHGFTASTNNQIDINITNEWTRKWISEGGTYGIS